MATSDLLQSLLTGTEESDKILLQDSVDHNARPLLKYCIHCLTKRFSVVHLFLFDIDSAHWLKGMTQQGMEKVKVHDCFSNSLGWTNTSSFGVRPNNCSIQSFVNSLGVESQQGVQVAIVIDSLSSLLLHQSSAIVCKIVHALGEHCGVMVSLVHADLHQDHVISQLCHVTSTNMLVQSTNSRSTSPGSSDGCGLCSITHRRKSGKVLRKTECYTVSRSFTVLATSDYEGLPHPTDETDKTDEPDPTANLTFDLRLSSKEKEDRSNVILPYTSVRDGVGVVSGPSTGHAQAGSGQIYYQPDEVDDFDESDPDDDLDI